MSESKNIEINLAGITLIGSLIVFFAYFIMNISGLVKEEEPLTPIFKPGEHVIIKVSGNEGVVRGMNGCSKGKGCTLKVTEIKTGIEIPRIHENDLMKVVLK